MKIKRSITLKEGEVNRSKDSQKETRSRANGGKRPIDFVKLAAASVAGTLLFTAGADARKLKSPDTAPALRGKDLRETKKIKYPVKKTGGEECRGTIVRGHSSVGRGFQLEPWPSWLSGLLSGREW